MSLPTATTSAAPSRREFLPDRQRRHCHGREPAGGDDSPNARIDRHGTKRVAKAMLIGAIPPLMLILRGVSKRVVSQMWIFAFFSFCKLIACVQPYPHLGHHHFMYVCQ